MKRFVRVLIGVGLFVSAAAATSAQAQNVPVGPPLAADQNDSDSGPIVPPTGSSLGRPVVAPTVSGTGVAVPARPAPATPRSAAAAPAAKGQAATPVTAEGGTAFGKWLLQCPQGVTGKIKCQIQERVLSQGGQALLVLAFAYDPKAKQTLAQIALPLDVAINYGVQVVVGDKYQGNVAISRCAQQGCIVDGAVTGDMLAALMKGGTASIIVFNQAQKQIPLGFSLDGFPQAFAAMQKQNMG
jgi:invasion protein IalB